MTVERRVVVLSRGGRLGGFATQVLSDGNGTTLACLESPAELADWKRPPIDVVLLDFPRRNRGIVYRQLRQRYRGPVLALLDPGEDGGLPPSRGPLAILNRPFSGEELAAVLSVLLAPPVEGPLEETSAPPAEPAEETTEVTAVLPAEVVVALAEVDAPPAEEDAAGEGAGGAGGAAGPAASPGRSRWGWLGRRRLRRWEIVSGAAGIVLLGLSLSVQSGCKSSCAGAAESGGPREPVDPRIAVGPGFADPPYGPDGAAASTGAVSRPGQGGRAAVKSGVGSLITAVGGTGPGTVAIRPLLVSPASAIATGGGLVVSGPASPSPSPSTNPPTTQPPPTSPPPTSPPPTTAPPPPPPTTSPPPPTTEPPPPTTEPPTTEPPTTEPPTTEPPTTEPPTTEPPPTTALALGGS